MRKYQYKCTLLSDIIITSLASTEGYKESLDYIPGAKFLGIVAGKLYDEKNESKVLDLFHNGNVRFSDATPLFEDEVMLKSPFSWFHKKGEGLSDTIYLHHKITANSNIQLKQARKGYFSPTKRFFTDIEQDFSIKSAYNSEKRKAEDGLMYGYFCLKKGSTWSFIVEDDKGIYSDEIKNVLLGNKRVGRSRSAEYGLVNIEFVDEINASISTNNTHSDEIILYAQSNLCFYDKFGKTTALPNVKQIVNTENATIDWSKSQIRSRNYQTWNRHRSNRDTDRIIIEKGSVFFIKLEEDIFTNYFEKGIGSHKAEGFGSVIVNPSFLISTTDKLNFTLKKKDVEYSKIYSVKKGDDDDLIFHCIEQRKSLDNFDAQIDKKANDFIKLHKSKFQGLSKSQWGILRNYAKNMNDKVKFELMIFDEQFGFLYRGQSESEWKINGRRDILKSFLQNKEVISDIEYLPFIAKLSNLMAKNNK